MFGWGKRKTEVQQIIERDGMQEAVVRCARTVGLKIPTVDVYRQFLLEELDAAQHGNAEAQAFAHSAGIPHSEYNGAMRRSFPEVDGPNGPQQALVRLCHQLGGDSEEVARFRIAVIRELMAAVSRPPPEIRTEEDVHRLIREQGSDVATRTLGRLAFDGNLMCQIVLSQFGLKSLEDGYSEATWRQCEQFTKMAAEQGDAASQCNLAKLYSGDVESHSNPSAHDLERIKQAQFWHRKAAAQGFAESVEALKVLLPEIRSHADIEQLIRELGDDVADRTVRRLADAGNLICQQYLSTTAFAMLGGQKMGLSFLQDEDEMARWWNECELYTKLAAEQGHARSQFNLAELYYDSVESALEDTDGYLNVRDHELIQKAKLWYRKAAAQGFEAASKPLQKLEAVPDDAYAKVLESNRRREELREKAPYAEPDEEFPF